MSRVEPSNETQSRNSDNYNGNMSHNTSCHSSLTLFFDLLARGWLVAWASSLLADFGWSGFLNGSNGSNFVCDNSSCLRAIYNTSRKRTHDLLYPTARYTQTATEASNYFYRHMAEGTCP